MASPSQAVLKSFGVRGRTVALDGGEGLAVRAGDVVLKQVHDEQEAAWTQGLLAVIVCDGFGVAAPLAAATGGWVHEGWVASRYLPDLRPAAPDWDAVIDAGLRFGDAAELVRRGDEDVLRRRRHRWAVADRVAWDEEQVRLPSAALEVQQEIEAVLTGLTPAERHFVHGDLSGNVFLDGAGVPVVLDVSPYLRPRRWAAAVVVADAVLWEGADPALACSFAADAADRDLLGRALVYRMVAEQLADHPRRGALLAPYRSVLAALR